MGCKAKEVVVERWQLDSTVQSLRSERRRIEVHCVRVQTQLKSANDKIAAVTADAAESRKVVQQMAEENACSSELSLSINPSVAREAGLPSDTRASPPVKTPNRTFFNCNPRPTSRPNKEKSFAANKPPKVFPGWDSCQVKRRTGFPTEAAMLAYIIVVCGGDVTLIKSRCSSLTWYEEWFFHFEFKWGRTLTRWVDAQDAFDIKPMYLRQIHRRKLSLEKRAQERLWPKFLSYDEDVCSKYYAGNCFKGGIFIQLSGWHSLISTIRATEHEQHAGGVTTN